MCLSSGRRRLGQELLAGVRRVPFAAAICVATDVAVGVANVVAIFGIELVWEGSISTIDNTV